MTSKVKLFMVRALSAWCWSLCSAIVRSSVSKSFICWESSSFQDSRSEIIWRKKEEDNVQLPTTQHAFISNGALMMEVRNLSCSLLIDFTDKVGHGLDTGCFNMHFKFWQTIWKNLFENYYSSPSTSACDTMGTLALFEVFHQYITCETGEVKMFLSPLLKESVDLKYLFSSSDCTK